MAKDSKALALLTTKSEHVHFSKDSATQRLLDRLAQLAALEAKSVHIALQLGAMLWQTKAALAHGEFQPWIRTNVGGRSYRNCAYYMKLALVFAEKTRPTEAELQSLIAQDMAAAPESDEARRVLAEIERFVGELSLTELLIKHGIKSVGLKAELTGGDEPPAQSEEERAQQQLALVWEQAYQPVRTVRELLQREAMRLTPEQREALKIELTDALRTLDAA